MRLVGRIAIVLGIALASGAAVMTVCYIPATFISGQPLYACYPVTVKGPGSFYPSVTPQHTCGISPIPWWVKAAGLSGFLASGVETTLVLRRRRGAADCRTQRSLSSSTVANYLRA